MHINNMKDAFAFLRFTNPFSFFTGEGTWNAKKRFPVGTRLARYQHQLSYARRERGEDDE